MALACGEEMGGEGAGGLGSGAFRDSRRAWILESSSEREAGAKGESSVRGGAQQYSPTLAWDRTPEPTFLQTTRLARFWWRHRSRAMGHFHLLKPQTSEAVHWRQISGKDRGPVGA